MTRETDKATRKPRIQCKCLHKRIFMMEIHIVLYKMCLRETSPKENANVYTETYCSMMRHNLGGK